MTTPRRSRKSRNLDDPRAIAYLRVSTQAQGESGLGLDAQRAIVDAEIARKGWTQVRYVVEIASGKDVDGRPLFAEVLDDLAAGRADVLLVAKQDRVSRSVHDFAGMIERASKDGWRIVVPGDADMSTTSGETQALLMAVFSQHERRRIGERTADALAANRRAGKRHAAPSALPAEVIERVVELRAAGTSIRGIAQAMNDAGIPTARGGEWRGSTVQSVLATAEYVAELATRS